MTTNIVQQDINALLDGWIEAERSGVQFPVPFDLAWGVAGYSKKANAKREIVNLDASMWCSKMSSKPSRNVSGVTAFEYITLSVDGFKDFCLLAKTPAGRKIRQYFIDAEKRWKLVGQLAPVIAQEVEILAMKIELAKIEAQTAAMQDKSLSLRHYVVTALPKPTADRILGVTEVQSIEYRDRVVKDNQILNDGGTINKTALCQRYAILSKNGKPDYKRLNFELATSGIPESAWVESEVVQTNRELSRDYLSILDRALYTAEQRQMFLGE